MRPLSKTDLRRSGPALYARQSTPPAPRTATGAAEEALLFGETDRAAPLPPPSPERERNEQIDPEKISDPRPTPV